MSTNSGSFTCMGVCWGLAGVVGLLAAVMLWAVAGWMVMQGLFISVVLFLALGLLFSYLFCRDLPAPNASALGATKPAAAPEAKARVAPATAKPAPAAAAAPKPAAVPKATPPAAAPAPTAAASSGGTRPTGLSAARDGTPDDLKRIKGVGPKMEKLLNSLGFYHFDQVAAWSADEVAWVDDNLEGFKGRVTRDNWIEQARDLSRRT